MKKVTLIDAEPEAVQAVFADVAAWPEWAPSVKWVRILEQRGDTLLVELEQPILGRQRQEVRRMGDRLLQRQVAGWLKRWEALWTFRRPPSGAGTTVSVDLVIDPGWIGILSPRAFVQRSVDHLFDGTIEGAKRRLQSLSAAGEAELLTAAAGGEPLLQLFETPDGMELVIAGRRYRLHPLDF